MNKSREAFRTISEVSDWLETPAHVLRFWESKFSQIRPVKGAGGRRYYRPEDMALLGGIKFLLHEQGLTIKGAQKLLREQGVRYVASLGPQLFADDDAPAPVPVAAVIAPAFLPALAADEGFDPAVIDAPAVDAPAKPAATPMEDQAIPALPVPEALETEALEPAQAEPEALAMEPPGALVADVGPDAAPLPDTPTTDTPATDPLVPDTQPDHIWHDDATPTDALPVTAAPPVTPDAAQIATAILSGQAHPAPHAAGIGQRLAALAERAESMRANPAPAATEAKDILPDAATDDAALPVQPPVADQISAESLPAESPAAKVTLRRPLHQMLIHLMLSAPVQQAQDRETLAALRSRLHDARARISIE